VDLGRLNADIDHCTQNGCGGKDGLANLKITKRSQFWLERGEGRAVEAAAQSGRSRRAAPAGRPYCAGRSPVLDTPRFFRARVARDGLVWRTRGKASHFRHPTATLISRPGKTRTDPTW